MMSVARRYQPVAVLLLALSPLLRVVERPRPRPRSAFLDPFPSESSFPLLLLLRLGRLLLRVRQSWPPRRPSPRPRPRSPTRTSSVFPSPISSLSIPREPTAAHRSSPASGKYQYLPPSARPPLLPEHPVQPALAPLLVPHPRQRLPLEVHQGQGEVGRCGALVVSVADDGGGNPGGVNGPAPAVSAPATAVSTSRTSRV